MKFLINYLSGLFIVKLVLFLVFYFLGSFIHWNYNPANWNIFTRIIVGVAFVIIIVIFTFSYMSIVEEDKIEKEKLANKESNETHDKE